MKQRHSSNTTASRSPSNTLQQQQRVPYSLRFRLPSGWAVQQYYCEPGTGRKFRSLKEVQRYLYEKEYSYRRLPPPNHNSGDQRMIRFGKKNREIRRMIISGGKLLKLDDEQCESHLANLPFQKVAPDSPWNLPDGWIVEERPRKYSNLVDKYYYEPGTGKIFRSLVSIERYLEENATLSKALKEIKKNKPQLKVYKRRNKIKNSTPEKKNILEENEQASYINDQPMKVNWVLASPQGDAWNPFISETLVPDPVKQQWTARFMMLMNDGIRNLPTPS